MEFIVIIPARFGSTRFPGKILAEIEGKPMIQHVHERAIEAGASQVIVATDDARIQQAVQAFNGEVCLTSTAHESGTSRLSEVIEQYALDEQSVVVNVQGDEPFIPAQNIRQVAQNLHTHSEVPMATLAYPIDDIDDVFNPNVVKVVTDDNNMALYFSRASIPYDRDSFMQDTPAMLEQLSHGFLRHIGIYGYRAGFVKQYVQMPATQLEKCESLEQLRVLWHGHKIHVDVAEQAPPHGVDTPEDLHRLVLDRNRP